MVFYYGGKKGIFLILKGNKMWVFDVIFYKLFDFFMFGCVEIWDVFKVVVEVDVNLV